MTIDLTPSELRTVMRRDFYTYMTRCFDELHGGAPFRPNWHMEVIAAALQDCMSGKINRLIINLPPRHLKSLMASIALPAFWLGHHPNASIIAVSYGQALSDKFARDCRTVMTSSWHCDLFATRLTNPRTSLADMNTTVGGCRLATSVGGVLTGRGADLIIIDDPLKPDEAVSETQRRNVNDWFDGTLFSRLNNKAEGVIIAIMQRLHEDDLVGYLLKQEGWTVLSFPAIAESDETHVAETILGRKQFRRTIGESLHPERESLETLKIIRETIGTYNFAGQYQQMPAPAGGGMVHEDWFRRYDPATLDMAFDQTFQSWDTANTPAALADYSVCTSWGLKDGHFYLLNVFRKKLAYPDLKRAVREQHGLYAPSVVLIEDKASGTQLIQDLIEEGFSQVKGVKPEGDKIMRLHAQTATIENGFVHIPANLHWVADYLHEMSVFPNGRYDDQVDSTAQAIAWTKLRPLYTGFLGFYKVLADENRAAIETKEGPMVRLRVPDGIGSLQTWSGRHLTVPDDRIAEVSTYDAGPLKKSSVNNSFGVEAV
jgi:predicted phage terminase large subunit-like protein